MGTAERKLMYANHTVIREDEVDPEFFPLNFM